MQIDFNTLLSFMGACQGFILAIFLFLNKKMQQTGKILAVFTILFSVGLLEGLIAPLRNNQFLFWLPDMVGVSSYLYGPLLYCYIFKSLKLSERFIYHKHFFIFYTFIISLLVTEIYRQFFNMPISVTVKRVIEILAFELLFTQLFVYCYLCIDLINKQRVKQQNVFVNWLWYLTISLTIIYLISFISTNLLLLGFNFEKILLSIVQAGSVIVVYSFSYHALLNKDMAKQSLPITPKYLSSSMIEDNKSTYLAQIVDSMEKDKLYLDPLLTLDKLSDILGVNRFYISQVINEKIGKNFSDFVNSYRVAQTKDLLLSAKGKQYTLLAIAYESGFNSKTSFNAVFKRHTGQTPSAYRKAHHTK